MSLTGRAPRPRTNAFVALMLLAALGAAGLVAFLAAALQPLSAEQVTSARLWVRMVVDAAVITAVVGGAAAAALWWLLLRPAGRKPLLFVAAILGFTWLVAFGTITLVSYPRAVAAARHGVAEEVRAYLREMLARQQRYMQQVQTLNLGQILTPEALSAPNGIASARQALIQARQLSERQNTEAMEAQIRMQGRLEVLAPARAAAFQQSSARARAAIAEAQQLNDAIIVETWALLDLMEQTRGRWSAQNGGLAFSDETVMQAYGQRISNLRRLGERTAAMQTVMQARAAALERAIVSADPLAAFNQAMQAPDAAAQTPQ